MKKGLIFIATALCTFSSFAVAAQENIVEQSGYILPQTSLEITLTVSKEEVIVGPFAKYSQQLLGISAPLNNKLTYSIADVNIQNFREADGSQIYSIPSAESSKLSSFEEKGPCNSQKVPMVESTSLDHITYRDLGFEPIVNTITSPEGVKMSQKKSFDDMAKDASKAIFTLRKRRFDLISGDMGEGVFGEGLKAALEEMSRIENEYLSLFIGKKTTSYKTHTFTIVPEKGKSSYILSRFSDSKGIRDITQMDGNPLIVTLTAEQAVKEKKEVKKVVEEPKKGQKILEEVVVKRYRVADYALCKLFCASSLLETKRLPIYQFGATVELTQEVEADKK